MTNFVPITAGRRTKIEAAGRDFAQGEFSSPEHEKKIAGPRGGLTPWETKFVLYRPSHNKDKKDKIVLVSDRKGR